MVRNQEKPQFWGIWKRSLEIIFSHTKIFCQITLAFVLPISILLALPPIFHLLFHKEDDLLTQLYNINIFHLVFKWTVSLTLAVIYCISLLIIPLFPASIVTYTVSCIYIREEVTIRKVMTVVPIVWRRLIITSICCFVIILIYSIIVLVLISCANMIRNSEAQMAVLFALVIPVSCWGFIHMLVIWHFASVVSVLEDTYGIKAMIKSRNLISGKIAAYFVLMMLDLCLVIIQLTMFAADGKSLGTLKSIVLGILCFLLLTMLILVGLVIQTVAYFACKAFQGGGESFQNNSLAFVL